MGKGLDRNLAAVWREALSHAIHDVQNDTPLNRVIRAELALESAQGSVTGQESSPSAPSTPL